jgi:hypothetical protein
MTAIVAGGPRVDGRGDDGRQLDAPAGLAGARRVAARHTAPGAAWAIWSRRAEGSFTSVVQHDGLVDVQVGDLGLAGAGGPVDTEIPPSVETPLSRMAASLHRGGGVVLDACAAPPALHISRDGIWLLPAMGGAQRRLAPGDRLLLWSAAALEAHPSRLLTVLHREAADLLAMSPSGLVGSALSGTGCGAAAVAVALRGPSRPRPGP